MLKNMKYLIYFFITWGYFFFFITEGCFKTLLLNYIYVFC